MKVSINWLKELVELNCSVEDLLKLLPLRTIGIKEVTDSFIELDMKGYNRADLLSMRGVALEVAAITGSKVLIEEPEEANFVWNIAKLPTTPVRIEEDILAQVQCVAKIEGLTFGKSSEAWIKKLENSGMRPVNNIADVTNLVMLEFGQPLHAFDKESVQDETINVRSAKKGEEITTLDGKLRKLTADDIVLADTQKALDVAGVMGGKDTEVKESTTTILLSASLFNPEMVRKTSQRLGLQSEASKRFYHGLTKKRLLQSLNAAIKMYQKIGGRLTAITIVGNLEDKVRKVFLTKKKLEELVGVRFENSEVEDYLQRLGFTLGTKGDALRGWEATVPYWRLDIEIEEDLIEEVARMYGYEKIPAKEVSESKPLQSENPIFQKISDLKNKLVETGLTEVQTYSFYSTRVLQALEILKEKLVKIANPISSQTEYLRQDIWPNLLDVTDRNLRKGFKDIAIFEIGKAFSNINGDPSENYRLAIVLCNNTDNPLEELAYIAKKMGFEFKISALPTEAISLFHPKRFLKIEKDGKKIGSLSEIHLKILNNLGIEKRVAVLEITV